MGIFIKDKLLVIIKKNKVRTLQSRRKELDRGKQREMAFGQKWSKSRVPICTRLKMFTF